jgi:putative oxidoreductase
MISTFVDKGKPYAALILRLVIAWRLLAGTWPYIVSSKPVQEVIGYFQSLHLPFPSVSAYLSLYAQFICGIFLAFGWLTRPATTILFINFSVALLVAHLHDPIESSFQAWALWATAIYFFFHGAGHLSIDKLIDWMSFKSFDIKIDDM